jgi:hypothetical protein
MRAATISQALGKAFRKSNTHSAKVSGWSNTHEGFIAKQEGEMVLVSYELGDWNKTRGAERIEAKAAQTRLVADYLTAAGYRCEFAGQNLLVIEKAA